MRSSQIKAIALNFEGAVGELVSVSCVVAQVTSVLNVAHAGNGKAVKRKPRKLWHRLLAFQPVGDYIKFVAARYGISGKVGFKLIGRFRMVD